MQVWAVPPEHLVLSETQPVLPRAQYKTTYLIGEQVFIAVE